MTSVIITYTFVLCAHNIPYMSYQMGM